MEDGGFCKSEIERFSAHKRYQLNMQEKKESDAFFTFSKKSFVIHHLFHSFKCLNVEGFFLQCKREISQEENDSENSLALLIYLS